MTPSGASPDPARAKARRAGQYAESWAAGWLRCKGYRIMARGFRCPGGEIDVIAQRGRTLAFVKVKYRADLTQAAEAIDARKQARVITAARTWLASHPGDVGLFIRFDAMLMRPWRWPRHLIDAWRS
ncbi:MAG: putative endonuclease [Alphaproteobacteria bacterium]|jgi:putative endonuclease